MQDQTVCFCQTVENQVLLMVGVHVDYSFASGEQGTCDEFYDKLKQHFRVKTLVEIKSYTGCAFEREWDNGIFDMS